MDRIFVGGIGAGWVQLALRRQRRRTATRRRRIRREIATNSAATNYDTTAARQHLRPLNVVVFVVRAAHVETTLWLLAVAGGNCGHQVVGGEAAAVGQLGWRCCGGDSDDIVVVVVIITVIVVGLVAAAFGGGQRPWGKAERVVPIHAAEGDMLYFNYIL